MDMESGLRMDVITLLQIKQKLYVNVIPEGIISQLSSDDYAKVIEVNIESCRIGYPLLNDACICRFELNTS